MRILILWICLLGQSFGTAIKNLVQIDGARDNQLVGYGLVVGLDGKGDSSADASTARQSLRNMMQSFGVNHNKEEFKSKNVAAVMVTADVKSFLKSGSRIDVTVSSIGDAKSLQGGTLIQTPLQGADGVVYAVAQGAVVVGGYTAGGGEDSGGSASVQRNHPTVGCVPDGAIIEKEIQSHLLKNNSIDLNLMNPNFLTSVRIADSINKFFPGSAQALSPANVNVIVPESYRGQLTNFIAQIGMYDVIPDTKAKIVINEKTGTIVATEQVRISTVAVSHGNLTISVQQKEQFSPSPLIAVRQQNHAKTKNVQLKVKEELQPFTTLEDFPTIQDLTIGLNQMGASTRDMITILQNIKAAGALQAELITL